MAEGPPADRPPHPDVVAAREAVMAARRQLVDETERLEASARAAVDIPSKVKRNPGRTAGLAAGAGFLLLGGPGRVVKGLRKAIGRPEPLPKSMLPDEVEKTLRKMGDDGQKVRGTLEREFAKYLEQTQEKRQERDLGAVAALLLSTLAKPAITEAGKRFAKDLASPDRSGFNEQLERIRARAKGAVDEARAGAGSPTAPSASGAASTKSPAKDPSIARDGGVL